MAVPMASFAKAVTFVGFKHRVAGMALCDIPTCFITCPKLFCVTGVILLQGFQKMSCIVRGRRSTLDVSIVILRGRHSTLDVSCCVFFADLMFRAASSGDNVQIPWQAWYFVRCDENWRTPRTKHRFSGSNFYQILRFMRKLEGKHRFCSYKFAEVLHYLRLQHVSSRFSDFLVASPCLWWGKLQSCEGFKTGCNVVLRGRRGMSWKVSKVVLCDRRKVFRRWVAFFRGRRSTSDVSHCVFFANRIVRAASSGDKVQIPWQVWDIDIVRVSFWVAQYLVKIRRVWNVLLRARCSIWGSLHFALHNWHSTLHTLDSTLYTLHSALNNLHSTLYTWHSKLYTLHFTLYTWHPTLYTLHFTLHTPHPTLYTLLYILHFTLHALHFTLHTLTLYTPHSTLDTPHSTLDTPSSKSRALFFTLYTLHFTLHTPHFTLYTWHSTRYTPHFTL